MDTVRKERLERQAVISNPSLPTEDRRAAAVIEKMALMKSFGESVLLTKPSEMQPSASLMAWVAKYLVDEDGAVARGQALTQVLWLPPAQRYATIEYLKGEGSYSQQGPGFVATLKNVSDHPLKIEHSYTWRAIPATHASIGWVDGPTGEGVRGVKLLEPGGVITMTPHFAIMNLQRHCLTAHDPVRWGTNATLPLRDALVEIGYRCLGLQGPDGEPLDSDALRRRAAASAGDDVPRRRGREAA